MDQVKARVENGIQYIELIGRIDSTNAAKVEEEINALRAENSGLAMVLDADKLDYISSAGLRVILRLRKSNAGLKIINVNIEVYDILEMTGFTEMLPVEKAYRRISVEGCPVIGRGSNGIVYRIDPETVVKVYFNADALEDIQRERELARKAFVMDIPTAMSYDVARVGDSYGSVFELVNAKSFVKLILSEPENRTHYCEMFVDFLKNMHRTCVKPGELPDIKETALGWAHFVQAHLPEDQGSKLLRLVSEVPVCYNMLHGDYHMKNLLMQNGEPILLDMDTLSAGHPVFEMASIFLAYVGFNELHPEKSMDFMGLPYDMMVEIWDFILHRYLETDDEARIRDVEKKAMVIGYMRLLRRTIRRLSDTEEGRQLIAHCKKRLAELLPQVETLVF